MRLLLDTHTFLWMADSPESLGERAREALLDHRHRLALSLASVWEMAIKIGLGKLTLSTSLEGLVQTGLTHPRIELLPIELPHVLRVQALPQHHRDPFDRLLVAQALTTAMPIISRDAVATERPESAAQPSRTELLPKSRCSASVSDSSALTQNSSPKAMLLL